MADSTAQMGGYDTVLKLTGFKSRNTIKRLIDEKDFPRPYELVAGRKSFSVSEVEQWLQEQMSQQRGAAA